jgi:two-component system OmpR family sensor kinase
MRGLRSIRWQLQAWHGLLLAVILAGLGVTAWHFERTHRVETLDQELQSLTALLSNSNRPKGRGASSGGRDLRLPPEVASLFDAGGKYYYGIWLKNGDPFTASANAPEPLPKPLATSGVRERDGMREAFFSPAPDDIYLVGTSVERIDARIWQVAAVLAAVGVAIWAIGMLVGAWFIGRSLRPIGAISETAAGIAEGDLSRRIDIGETESELGALAQTLNTTFARLDAVFARQSQFTADAAHELRTPVTVLLTHIQNTLLADDLSADNREAIEACQRAAQRMRKLIESLLQLARFDAGSELIEYKSCDLVDIALEAVELTRPLADQKGLVFDTTFGPARFLGDYDRISQVLVNLVSNAVHYNRPDGRILVSTQTEGQFAICTVTNTGPGIREADRAHLFERFYRADSSRSARGRSGLGLAISRAIVHAHGGQIEVFCGMDETTFVIRLPGAKLPQG